MPELAFGFHVFWTPETWIITKIISIIHSIMSLQEHAFFPWPYGFLQHRAWKLFSEQNVLPVPTSHQDPLEQSLLTGAVSRTWVSVLSYCTNQCDMIYFNCCPALAWTHCALSILLLINSNRLLYWTPLMNPNGPSLRLGAHSSHLLGWNLVLLW